jgi:hypothetical protein
MWLIYQFELPWRLGICKEYLSMPRAKTPRTTTGTSRIKQVLPTPQFKAVPEPKTEQGNDTPTDVQAEIRRRAYELYQERGCVPGFEHEDWVVAEREVMARYSLQAV